MEVGKTVEESAIVLARLMNPADANPSGNVHGGVIMKMVDEAGGAVAIRHSRCRCVTVAMDYMSFRMPVYIGDLVTVRAHLTYVGTTSMEIEALVEAENLRTGKITHTSTCHLVYVALDEHGHPTGVPQLIIHTPQEQRRWDAAVERRKRRPRE
jgi:acyl-CoA hydrolase